MSESVLEVRGLTIALPAGSARPAALADLSLEVRRGEILCLVGESGSGKSVLAHSVMGLAPRSLAIAGGSILLEGEDLVRAAPARLRALRGRRMAMIFQEPSTALNPTMRCGAQIEEVLGAHTALDAAARRRRTLEMLAEVALADPARIARAYPHQISGGERQRVMIAAALALEPALVIADEPTSALDVSSQAQVLRLIAELQARHGTALLFITHDFGVVAEIAHRVAVLCEGRLVEIGARDEVLRRPRHDYTRMLLAAVPRLAPRARAPAPAPAPLLSVQGLSMDHVAGGGFGARRRVAAAREVALELGRGETLGIVGASGSGKSTVARCIARLVRPDAGAIRLGATDLAQLSARELRPLRRRVQIVFQDPNRSLDPRRRVGDSIIEGPLNFGVARAAALERARELMRLVRLDPAALGRYPHQFSGGERQRICIARALAPEPELLIADEAVSALDVSVQAQVLELLEEIRDRLALAMIFVTHDLRVAARICDRVAVMAAGRIVETGTAAQVLVEPRHAATRALLAAAPGRAYWSAVPG